jgi:O-antigen ligase
MRVKNYTQKNLDVRIPFLFHQINCIESYARFLNLSLRYQLRSKVLFTDTYGMNVAQLKALLLDKSFSSQLPLLAGTGMGIVVAMAILLPPNPAFVVLALVAITAIILSLIYPHLGLAALVFITYTEFSGTMIHYHGAPSIEKLFIPFLIVVALGRLILFGERPYAWQKPLLILFGFLLACSVSLMFVRDLPAAQERIIDLIKNIIMIMTVLVLMRTRQAFVFSFWALILAGAFLGTIAVFQYLTDGFDSDFWGFGQAAKMHMAGTVDVFRIGGPIGDPNFFSQIMLVLLPIALDRALHSKHPLLRTMAGWSFAACILTVFFTFSRGALLAVFGMIALVMKQYRPSPVAIIILVSVAIAATPFMPDRYLDRLLAIPEALTGGQNTSAEASLRGRLSEQLSGLLMFVEHPLLGVGPKNYPANYQDYAQRAGLDSRHTERNAHNLFLEVAAETGLVGSLFFGAVLFLAFKSLRTGRKTLTDMGENSLAAMVAALELGLIGYLIAALFLHGAYPSFFWVLIAISFGVSNFTGTMLERNPVDEGDTYKGQETLEPQ